MRHAVEEALHARAERLLYDDARRYVEARGWVRIPTRRSEVGVFRFGDHEAQLPMDNSLGDYATAMVLFARAVAEAEQRSPEQVIADLGATRVDRHRPARVQQGEPEGASLDATTAMLDGIRRALLASACSVLAPRAFHPRMSFSDAEAFVAEARFSHTEVGSFVMVVDTPIELDDAPVGFGREASVLLVRSLAHLARSLRAGTPNRVAEPLEGEPQVSANLCEALLRMAPPSEAADLRFQVSWSPLLPVPIALTQAITIDRGMYEGIESLAQSMRPKETSQRDLHVGSVIELKGSLGASGLPEGEVVFSLFDREATFVRAKAQLDAAAYAKALQAHASGKWVRVDGVLHRVRRGYELRSIASLDQM